jgi:drug/metabolite transporter (DMT)-like permease
MFALVFRYLSIFSVLFPLIGGLQLWKSLNWPLKLLFWLALTSGISDCISVILASNKIHTLPIANAFLIVQFVLLFVSLEANRKLNAKWFLFILCVLFGVINYFFLQTPDNFNTYSAYLFAIFMLVSVMESLTMLMKNMPVEKIQTLPIFWLSFGVLVYYAGTLFLFLFNNYLIVHLPRIHQNIWVIHNLLNISKNFFLFMALWVNYKSKTSPS